ncbi:Enoyl-CoA hydratase [Minicystis rosea]|nr:Enoyl-CoA hydratase [Minicystis rosea]
MPIHRTLDDGVAVLGLDLGRGNAIDHPFVDALSEALDQTLEGGARAVVLTGRGKVFSSGLDLLTIHAYDRTAMSRFVDAFDGLFHKVLAFPRPVVAAVNGHALAGGCILAMAADVRVMAEGAFQIGVTEVALGLPFPAAAFEIVRRCTPSALAATVFLEGRRFSPGEALAAGIVDRVTDDPVSMAKEQARRFAANAVEAVADTKADLVAPVIARIEATREARRERFLDRWFAPDAQARISALRERLVKK